jgi:co-chaperonin GroES (HSP10)
MRLIPLGEHILIAIPKNRPSKGILLLNNQDENFKAIVLSIGEDVESRLKDGDTILVHKHAQREKISEDDSETRCLITKASILGIIHGQED